jgi:ribosomal-protein-alanine N-acetyltransferase
MIAAATAKDAPRLAALHAAAFATAWPAQEIVALMAGPGVFALLDGGEGFVMSRVAADEAEILTLVVAPSARRRGIGRTLVRRAAADAHKMGARSLFLEVSVKNDAAISLYRGLGFIEAGRRKGYYAGPGGPADALVLKTALPVAEVGMAARLD